MQAVSDKAPSGDAVCLNTLFSLYLYCESYLMAHHCCTGFTSICDTCKSLQHQSTILPLYKTQKTAHQLNEGRREVRTLIGLSALGDLIYFDRKIPSIFLKLAIAQVLKT